MLGCTSRDLQSLNIAFIIFLRCHNYNTSLNINVPSLGSLYRFETFSSIQQIPPPKKETKKNLFLVSAANLVIIYPIAIENSEPSVTTTGACPKKIILFQSSPTRRLCDVDKIHHDFFIAPQKSLPKKGKCSSTFRFLVGILLFSALLGGPVKKVINIFIDKSEPK